MVRVRFGTRTLDFWDTLKVAALLLRASCTRADRAGEATWEQSLDDLDKTFLDVLALNWDIFNEDTSIAQRD